MSEHAPDRIWSGIDFPKIIAGTLAAVSAAVVGSFLGVAGTLIGAAVASVIGSLGTELYSRFIQRGSNKIKSTFVTEPAAIGTPPVVAARREVPSDEPVPASTVYAARRNVRWGRIVAVAGALFVLAMGTLTAYELIAGRTVADAVGHKTSSSTTFGSAFGKKSSKSDSPKPAPSESAEPSPSPSEEAPESGAPTTSPTGEPTGAPTQTTEPADPQQTGGTEPGAPTDEPTGDPTDGDTQQGGTGGQEQPNQQNQQSGTGLTDGAE
ncbi:hypothetical protein [Actinoplanes solisilvae]|uniref:hypothetical protein n=1 Tax=Actinoplanes solisilvae TaxID=2486853 RepID=UPI000FDC1237|nr:hypothetical protein [Actinoplanes solisilvae]